jgi:hypothetical protein
MHRALAPWLFLLALQLPQDSRAAVPLAVEDADLLPAQACEWELGVDRVRPRDATAERVVDSRAGCTWWAHTQLNLAHTRSVGAEGRSVAWSAYGKTRLLARQDGQWGLTLAWELERARPAGEPARFAYAGAAAVLSRAWDDERWWLHLNLGLGRDRLARQSTPFWSVGVEFAPNDSVDWILEAYGERHARPSLGLGARVYLGENWSLGLMASAQRPGVRGLGAWLRWAF